ncbi:hypothetical protein HDU93_005771, partial [Gonapodya sp. JEL0774]
RSFEDRFCVDIVLPSLMLTWTDLTFSVGKRGTKEWKPILHGVDGELRSGKRKIIGNWLSGLELIHMRIHAPGEMVALIGGSGA